MSAAEINSAKRLAGQERRIKISQINIATGQITGVDTYGRTIACSSNTWEPIAAIPMSGETWVVKQYNNEWRLVRRAETGNETTPVANLQPGDRRLEAPGTLYLGGQEIVLTDLPTSAPIKPGRLWNNHGVLSIS